jgi:hypothetical protein
MYKWVNKTQSLSYRDNIFYYEEIFMPAANCN